MNNILGKLNFTKMQVTIYHGKNLVWGSVQLVETMMVRTKCK